MNKSCTDCVYASWFRTEKGRLHPSGDGRCTCVIQPVVMPRAFYFAGFRGFSKPDGGFIDRHKPYSDCPTWEKE